MAKVKVTMKQSFNEIVFYFNDCMIAGPFMNQAIRNGEDVTFVVEKDTRGEWNEKREEILREEGLDVKQVDAHTDED